MEENQKERLQQESSESHASSLFSNLRTFIDLVDNLRDVGLQKYITLPKIVTLGTQSSGKSSVMESIVGLDFLPRGEGVCTRRPLELRLVHITEKDVNPWAEFEEVQNKKFSDFKEVRKTIEQLTDRVAGSNKNIVDEPIVLTIHSPTCPDLSLIDLPGITRIPLKNSDQPENIEQITKQMAYRYVSDVRTIILCVIPANMDISTSEAIQMARRVDPEGKRTLGVVTKIDIMDKGTNARNLLLGEEVLLRLGYVGVKLRSQQDILTQVPVKAALAEEREFFQNHPVYSTMPPGYVGTETLSQKCSQVLFSHIRNILPEIVREIVSKIRECEERLKQLGPPLPVTMQAKVQLIWGMVNEFVEVYKNTVRGKYDKRGRSQTLTKDLEGGAKIRIIFNNLLQEYAGNFKISTEFSDSDIKEAIKIHGDALPGFPSIDAFMYLLQPQLEKLKDPVLECIQEIHMYLEQLAHILIERVFYRFPQMISEIQDLVSIVMSTEKEKTTEISESIIFAEESFIFTNDDDYLTKRSNFIPKGSQSEAKQQVDAEKIFITEMRERLDSYFQIVIRNVRDTIPKTVGYFLVRQIVDKLQYELYNSINNNQTIVEILNEPEHIARERETLSNTLDVLKRAHKVIRRDPNLAQQADLIEEELKNQERMQKEKEQKQEKKQAVQEKPAAGQVKKETIASKTNALFG